MNTATFNGRRLAYSPAEAAELLGVSRARVYQLLADGSIPSLSIGRSRRIRHQDLEQFLDKLAGDVA